MPTIVLGLRYTPLASSDVVTGPLAEIAIRHVNCGPVIEYTEAR
jgi:hypothetical protein